MDGLRHQFFSITTFAVRERFFKKIANGKSLSTFRQHQLSVELAADELHDRLLQIDGFSATQFDSTESILESDLDLIHIQCVKRKSYCSMLLRIWTYSAGRATDLRKQLENRVADVISRNTFFTIDWHYAGGKGGIESVLIDEMADAALCDDAYPVIEGGVQAFIDRYLDDDQAVLVIHGPPGTGKTRLVRAILGAISRRAKDACRIMFTGDTNLLGKDEIFMRFIGSGHQAFVVEDADHLLKPRKDGNNLIHRFLTISDGIVRAQGRKIIFTSNLPNLGDIDEALLRPGRCFACLTLPRLERMHVERLLPSLHSDANAVLAASEELFNKGAKAYSLAEIYKSLTVPGLARA